VTTNGAETTKVDPIERSTKYGPGVSLGIDRVTLRGILPWRSVVNLGEPTGQLVGDGRRQYRYWVLAESPVPARVTTVPTMPWVGLMEKLDVTVNVAPRESAPAVMLAELGPRGDGGTWKVQTIPPDAFVVRGQD
jgi:hypothetical protein